MLSEPDEQISTAEAATDTVAAEFGEVFTRTRRALRRAISREVGLQPLPEAQRELLQLVVANPGIIVGAAADRLHLAPNTVSTLLRQLCAVGLLERRREAGNLRVVHIVTTRRGRDRVSRYRDTKAEILARGFAALDPEARDRIAAALPALAQLHAALEARFPEEVDLPPGSESLS